MAGVTLAQAALGFSAASSVASGLMGRAQAKSQEEGARINSFIGRTRALQTDTNARRSLNEELGSLRSILAANGQAPSVGTFEVMQSLRDTRDRERRVEFGNRMSESADFRRQAQNFRSRGRGAMFKGFVGAGPSLFDLYQTL